MRADVAWSRQPLAIPVLETKVPESQKDVPHAWGEPVFQGLDVFRLTLDGFEPLGKITHIEGAAGSGSNNPIWNQYNFQIRRSLTIGDVLYAISNGKITASKLPGLEPLGTLTYADASEYPNGPILLS